MIAVVLGGALGGFAELAEVSRRVQVAKVFAVNDAAAEYPGHVDYFVTLHPAKLGMWLEKRRAAGLPAPGAVVGHVAENHVTEIVDYHWPGTGGSGSSGLYATKVALDRTRLPVVLCGVPMDPERTHYAESKFAKDFGEFRPVWKIALPSLKDRVRSMSGWTSELLGRPSL